MGKDLSTWVGARLYRGPDVHIADHFFFNDHSGQGFGIEFKKTRLAAIFVASTDTTATVPPYFYLNIKTGTPITAMRQRTVLLAEQDFKINENNSITALGEIHRMVDADQEVEIDSIEQILNFPSDHGWVLGARDTWARSHLRFVASLARYNDYAMESLYSPYLEFTGSRRWSYYFGVKAEWWIWN